MITLRQVMHDKGEGVWHVTPDATVYDAIKLMSEKSVGALCVLDGDRLAGVISERDYTRKIALKDRSSKATLVEEIMTPEVITVTLDNTLEECMVLMSDNGIRHLPIMDGERVTGMLSIKDVLKTLITEKEFIIQQLESYIAGAA